MKRDLNNRLIIKIYQQEKETCVIFSEVKTEKNIEHCYKFTSHVDTPKIINAEKYNTINNIEESDLRKNGYICKPFVCSFWELSNRFKFEWDMDMMTTGKWDDNALFQQLSASRGIYNFVYVLLLEVGVPQPVNSYDKCICRYKTEDDIEKGITIKNLINWIAASKYKHLQNHPETRNCRVTDETPIKKVLNKKYATYTSISTVILLCGVGAVTYSYFNQEYSVYLKPIGWILISVSFIALFSSYCAESPTLIRPQLPQPTDEEKNAAEHVMI